MHDPIRADDVPVTRKMLDEIAESLRSEIRSLSRNTDAKFIQTNAKFVQIASQLESLKAETNAKFMQVDAQLRTLEKRFDSEIEKVFAITHRNSATVEEQNARNLYVLDAWASLHAIHENHRYRLGRLENHAFGIEQD